jgi:hypothetical protein
MVVAVVEPPINDGLSEQPGKKDEISNHTLSIESLPLAGPGCLRGFVRLSWTWSFGERRQVFPSDVKRSEKSIII